MFWLAQLAAGRRPAPRSSDSGDGLGDCLGEIAGIGINAAEIWSMKGTRDQPAAVSIFLAIVFLAGAISVLWIAAEASKSGVVEMIYGAHGATTLYRASSPEMFRMCVAIYALAGIGFSGGFVYQARNAIRKLRTPGRNFHR
jgi:hypothetical protein